jgi:quercetin dioxygenase-like cupin family protein
MKKIPALLLTLTLTAPFAAFGFAECKPDANITTINGQGLPGRMATLTDEHVMVDTIVDVPQGYRMTITRAVRKAGTRVGIHVHKWGGTTCVLEGAMTDFVEGHAPAYYPAGTCYYMPPNHQMATSNMGSVDAVIQDIFIVPDGQPVITILEPGYPGCQ